MTSATGRDAALVTTDTPMAEARACIYAFLARVFRSHPTDGSVRALAEMATALGIASPTNVALDALDREYTELFVVPGPRYVAPYESVFRDRWQVPAVLKRGSNPGEGVRMIKGLLMGESTLAVRQSYLDAGVLPDEDLPDHIANELRFLAYLWQQAARCPADQVAVVHERCARFRHEHVLTWIGQLRQKVAAVERLGFYSAALAVAEVTLEADD